MHTVEEYIYEYIGNIGVIGVHKIEDKYYFSYAKTDTKTASKYIIAWMIQAEFSNLGKLHCTS